MIEPIQLDFFKDPEIIKLEAELERTKRSLDRVRKGTYARLNELNKKMDDMLVDHQIIIKEICKGE